MINRFGNFIEIKPMSPIGSIAEILSIDLNDRKIVSVHVHAPRSPKHTKIFKAMVQAYGMCPGFIVLEIVTSPDSTKSASMKTLEHEIVYFDTNDYNNDYSKIKSHIYEGKPL